MRPTPSRRCADAECGRGAFGSGEAGGGDGGAASNTGYPGCQSTFGDLENQRFKTGLGKPGVGIFGGSGAVGSIINIKSGGRAYGI